MSEFTQEIIELFDELIAEQEPLGEECQPIIFDDLWELYVTV